MQQPENAIHIYLYVQMQLLSKKWNSKKVNAIFDKEEGNVNIRWKHIYLVAAKHYKKNNNNKKTETNI